MDKQNTRGGQRSGAGRPTKPDKRVKTAITMRPDLYEKTAGDRSGVIEKALIQFYEASQ